MVFCQLLGLSCDSVIAILSLSGSTDGYGGKGNFYFKADEERKDSGINCPLCTAAQFYFSVFLKRYFKKNQRSYPAEVYSLTNYSH